MFNPEQMENGMLQLISLQDLHAAASFDPATHFDPHTVAPQFASSPMQATQSAEYWAVCLTPSTLAFGALLDKQSPTQI